LKKKFEFSRLNPIFLQKHKSSWLNSRFFENFVFRQPTESAETYHPQHIPERFSFWPYGYMF